MKHAIRYLLLVSGLLPAIPARASGPSFDCAGATRQIDKAICGFDGEMTNANEPANGAAGRMPCT